MNNEQENNRFRALLFIGQDTLNEIRDNKGHQRNITYQFVFIAVALFGLTKVLTERVPLNIARTLLTLKIIIGIYGAFTIYFLAKLQYSLSRFRRRLTRVWGDESFRFAFDEGILEYRCCDAEYYSFWNNFGSYTLLYILMTAVTSLIIFIL